jgi:uncharacterized membrane protein (DUF485 family)
MEISDTLGNRMKAASTPMVIAAAFIWIGFVSAISFMEAWLKFQAPGVSLSIGLSIGKLVFNALNKIELVLALIMAIALPFGCKIIIRREIFFFLPMLLLVLQTGWLLPLLSKNIDLHLLGKIPPHSNNHLYYVLFEIGKVASLLLYGLKLLQIRHTTNYALS